MHKIVQDVPGRRLRLEREGRLVLGPRLFVASGLLGLSLLIWQADTPYTLPFWAGGACIAASLVFMLAGPYTGRLTDWDWLEWDAESKAFRALERGFFLGRRRVTIPLEPLVALRISALMRRARAKTELELHTKTHVLHVGLDLADLEQARRLLGVDALLGWTGRLARADDPRRFDITLVPAGKGSALQVAPDAGKPFVASEWRGETKITEWYPGLRVAFVTGERSVLLDWRTGLLTWRSPSGEGAVTFSSIPGLVLRRKTRHQYTLELDGPTALQLVRSDYADGRYDWYVPLSRLATALCAALGKKWRWVDEMDD